MFQEKIIQVTTFLKAGKIIYPVLEFAKATCLKVLGCNLERLEEHIAFFKIEVPDKMSDEVLIRICEEYFGKNNVSCTSEYITFL
jgi:hypothetical protein